MHGIWGKAPTHFFFFFALVFSISAFPTILEPETGLCWQKNAGHNKLTCDGKAVILKLFYAIETGPLAVWVVVALGQLSLTVVSKKKHPSCYLNSSAYPTLM